jgi:hypothetical protein
VPDAPRADSAGGDVAAQLQQQVAERTADLQRVQAEYANYRRRVDRDREAVREAALANVLTNLLPVLDDIGRARDHGELEGGFKAVAEALEATVEKLGLARFGAEGDPFDPTVTRRSPTSCAPMSARRPACACSRSATASANGSSARPRSAWRSRRRRRRWRR